MSDALDGYRGRKYVSEARLDEGMHYRSDWAIALPSRFPAHTLLVVNAYRDTGQITLAISGLDAEADSDDGA